jgi:circadian clock protein KaiB
MKKKPPAKKPPAKKSPAKKSPAKTTGKKTTVKTEATASRTSRRNASAKTAVKKSPARKTKPKPFAETNPDKWTLRLYIAGDTPKSISAQENLKRLCDKHLPGKVKIEVIDLVEHPELARADQVLAIPTLVRKIPPPIKRIIGDLSNEERAMLALDLRQV